MFNLALHYTQNVQDAEEITQDVFLKVFDKLDDFLAQSAVSTWVYRITINASLDFIKSKSRIKRGGHLNLIQVDDQDKYLQLETSNHPGIELEQKEALNTLFNAINLLPNNQKTAIILLKIEQKKQSEVAEIMNISEKAVESLFQRGKKKLRELLNQTKEDES